MKPNLVLIEGDKWHLFVNGQHKQSVHAPPPSDEYNMMDVVEFFRKEQLNVE